MIHVHIPQPNVPRVAAPSNPTYPMFRYAPVQRDIGDLDHDQWRRTHQTAVASWLYITRQPGSDDLGMLPPAYLEKAPDLVATGRVHPRGRLLAQHREGVPIWVEADAATRADLHDKRSAMHIIVTLPKTPPEMWPLMIKTYAKRSFAAHGMLVDWAIHHRLDADGQTLVHGHAHLLVTTRQYRTGSDRGERHDYWLATTAQIRKAEDAWLMVHNLAATRSRSS